MRPHHPCGLASTGVDTDLQAQQRNEQYIGAGCRLRNGHGVVELRGCQPGLLAYQHAVHVGRGGNRAADRQQRHRQEIAKQVQPVGGMHGSQGWIHVSSLLPVVTVLRAGARRAYTSA
ncbi:hypothetical protein D3C71_1870730 [compost metagenome]